MPSWYPTTVHCNHNTQLPCQKPGQLHWYHWSAHQSVPNSYIALALHMGIWHPTSFLNLDHCRSNSWLTDTGTSGVTEKFDKSFLAAQLAIVAQHQQIVKNQLILDKQLKNLKAYLQCLHLSLTHMQRPTNICLQFTVITCHPMPPGIIVLDECTLLCNIYLCTWPICLYISALLAKYNWMTPLQVPPTHDHYQQPLVNLPTTIHSAWASSNIPWLNCPLQFLWFHIAPHAPTILPTQTGLVPNQCNSDPTTYTILIICIPSWYPTVPNFFYAKLCGSAHTSHIRQKPPMTTIAHSTPLAFWI